MNAYAEKAKNTESKSMNVSAEKLGEREPVFTFADNRPANIAQRRLKDLIHGSPQSKQTTRLQLMPVSPVVQLNENATQYAPNANQSMTPVFIAQHAPQGDDGYTIEEAIRIHEIRGSIDTNTIIAINGDEMANEIHTHLLGMSDDHSQRMVDEEWNQITFITVNSYPSIETTLDDNEMPVFSVAEITRIQVRMQYHNQGYFKVYHFSRKVT